MDDDYSLAFMDDQLGPIVQRANVCIEQDSLITDDQIVFGRDKEPWKAIFLVCIVFKMIFRLVGLVHQRRLLNMPQSMLDSKYELLDKDVTDLIPMTQLTEARAYNRGVNAISILWEVQRCIFEFVVILLDFPAFIWYGWLDVMRNDGHCDQDSQYGIWMHLALGVLFYLSLTIVNELWYLPTRLYEHCYERKMGFTEATNCQFSIFQIFSLGSKIITELPILILAAALLTATKKWFFVALFGATIVVNLLLVYIFPKCCMRCE